MKQYMNSKYLVCLYALILFSAMYINIKPAFRPDDLAVINKIIHPQYYTGEFFHVTVEDYNPYFNHHYTVAYAAKWFGFEDNLEGLGKVFWIIQHGSILLILIMLSNLLFNKDKMTLVVLIPLYTFYAPSSWSEAKFFAIPFILLSF